VGTQGSSEESSGTFSFEELPQSAQLIRECPSKETRMKLRSTLLALAALLLMGSLASASQISTPLD
jgi:hypothetical protein